jgi:hypothetical protein
MPILHLALWVMQVKRAFLFLLCIRMFWKKSPILDLTFLVVSELKSIHWTCIVLSILMLYCQLCGSKCSFLFDLNVYTFLLFVYCPLECFPVPNKNFNFYWLLSLSFLLSKWNFHYLESLRVKINNTSHHININHSPC